MKTRRIKRITQYILLILSMLMVLTGLGITEPGTIEIVTFGILGKSLAYRLHYYLWGGFMIFLIIHVYLSLPRRSGSENRETRDF
jgi:thiosulfate reductase cytochrome b subunit